MSKSERRDKVNIGSIPNPPLRLSEIGSPVEFLLHLLQGAVIHPYVNHLAPPVCSDR